MRIVLFFVLCLVTAPAQLSPLPAADLPPETVLATFADGRKLTIGELKRFMGVLPPQMQQTAMRDRKAFVQQYLLMHRLAELAEQAKLDQVSPTRESLAINRMYVMMNAQLTQAMNEIVISPADVKKFYDSNADRFTQAKVKVLYVSFSSASAPAAGGKKVLTEPEAKTRIEKLLADLRAGADFAKLAREHSEDATSAQKDGDFGTIRRSDSLPDAIREAIFALKPGEISEPVRQPNGFYLFRVDHLEARPLAEVQNEIFNELKQLRFKQWMDETQRSLNVKYENEAFFSQAPAAPAGK
jgi:parvulin-like peptidyl-prolyl isomerase